MKKYSKKLILILTLIFTLLLSTTAHAYVSSNDIDTQNSTKETAFVFEENKLEDSLTFKVKRLYHCYFTNSDEIGWYKLYLTSGDKTLTINSPVLATATVEDENNNVIFSKEYGKSNKKQGDFVINQPGYYYVKVISNENITSRTLYTLMLGAPDYERKHYTKKLNSMPLTSRNTTSKTVSFDMKTVSSIPDSAIVEKLELIGKESNKYDADGKTRYIRPMGSYWRSAAGIVYYDVEMLDVNDPLKVKQQWQFKHSATSVDGSYSLTPEIIFRYLSKMDY